MARFLKKEINLVELIKLANLDIKVNNDISIVGVSDSNTGYKNTIADYVKGPLPAKGTVLLTVEPIEGFVCLITDSPASDFYELIRFLQKEVGFKKHTDGTIADSVKIGTNVVIEKDVSIGEGTIIEHNVVIHEGTSIGANCIIRSGSVLGGEGYGFTLNSNRKVMRQPFIGSVKLRDEVEIGYNNAVVRGAIDSTILQNGVKLDNLVHIAHDCSIGKNSTITAGVSLCGYVNIGEGVRLAPQSTVKQRINIEDNALIGLGAVVVKNVEKNTVVAGNPAKFIKRTH